MKGGIFIAATVAAGRARTLIGSVLRGGVLAPLVAQGEHHDQHPGDCQDQRYTIGGMGRRAGHQGQAAQRCQATGHRRADLTACTEARRARLGRELAAEERTLRGEHHRREDAGADRDGDVDLGGLTGAQQLQERVGEHCRQDPA